MSQLGVECGIESIRVKRERVGRMIVRDFVWPLVIVCRDIDEKYSRF
jgi:hypothetical protein